MTGTVKFFSDVTIVGALWGVRGSTLEKPRFSFQLRKKNLFSVSRRGNVGEAGHFARVAKETVLVGEIKRWVSGKAFSS